MRGHNAGKVLTVEARSGSHARPLRLDEMAKRRSQIPDRVAVEVLFRSDHTCCVCESKGKEVQLHHIDGNPSNNKSDNLAVVCLECHSRVTRSAGLGRGYRPSEVRKYKRSWEQRIADRRGIHKPTVRYRKELVTQVDLIVCEALACAPKNLQRAKELLELLYELHLWRGASDLDKRILEGLEHLALMSGLNSAQLGEVVAEQIWRMCWHFAGPKHVPMNKRDVGYVLRYIDALRTLAEFNSEYSRGRSTAQKIAAKAENFLEVGIWYRKIQIVDAAIGVYAGGLKTCFHGGTLEFPAGPEIFRKSIRKAINLVSENGVRWKRSCERLRRLLSKYSTAGSAARDVKQRSRGARN